MQVAKHIAKPALDAVANHRVAHASAHSEPEPGMAEVVLPTAHRKVRRRPPFSASLDRLDVRALSQAVSGRPAQRPTVGVRRGCQCFFEAVATVS